MHRILLVSLTLAAATILTVFSPPAQAQSYFDKYMGKSVQVATNTTLATRIDSLFTTNTSNRSEIDALFVTNTANRAEIDALFVTNTATQASIGGKAATNANLSAFTDDVGLVTTNNGVRWTATEPASNTAALPAGAPRWINVTGTNLYVGEVDIGGTGTNWFKVIGTAAW